MKSDSIVLPTVSERRFFELNFAVFSDIMHKVVKYCLMSCDTICLHIHGLRTIESATKLFKIAQMCS